MDGIEKSPAEPLLEDVELLFIEDILEALLPAKLKMPQIKLYEGERDPTEHLETFRSWMELQEATGAVMCRAFSLTLMGVACKWYKKLKSSFIFLFTYLS